MKRGALGLTFRYELGDLGGRQVTRIYKAQEGNPDTLLRTIAGHDARRGEQMIDKLVADSEALAKAMRR